jgi:hypothetical protein
MMIAEILFNRLGLKPFLLGQREGIATIRRRGEVERIIRTDSALVPIFSAGIGTAYRVRSSSE